MEQVFWVFAVLSSSYGDTDGSATEAFCEYAVDRLELCMRSLSIILRHLRTPPSPGCIRNVCHVLSNVV